MNDAYILEVTIRIFDVYDFTVINLGFIH